MGVYNGYRENRRKELAAVLPDVSTFIVQEVDAVSIKKQFQNTLEANQKEYTATWVDSQGQLLVSITPKGLFRIGNGLFAVSITKYLPKQEWLTNILELPAETTKAEYHVGKADALNFTTYCQSKRWLIGGRQSP